MFYGSIDDYRYNDDFVLRMRDLRKGNLDLGWLAAGTEQLEFSQQNPKRGLTYLDLNQGSYGYDDLPEVPVFAFAEGGNEPGRAAQTRCRDP